MNNLTKNSNGNHYMDCGFDVEVFQGWLSNICHRIERISFLYSHSLTLLLSRFPLIVCVCLSFGVPLPITSDCWLGIML